MQNVAARRVTLPDIVVHMEEHMRVLVTGAASGIGRATCLRLARDGKASGQAAKVAAVDLGPSTGLDRLCGELWARKPCPCMGTWARRRSPRAWSPTR
jgi:hypothetical protein